MQAGEGPEFAEELEVGAVVPSRDSAQSAFGVASDAASVTEGRAGGGGSALGGQETGDVFACVASSSADPPAGRGIGYGRAPNALVEERRVAVDAYVEPAADQGVGLIVAA